MRGECINLPLHSVPAASLPMSSLFLLDVYWFNDWFFPIVLQWFINDLPSVPLSIAILLLRVAKYFIVIGCTASLIFAIKYFNTAWWGVLYSQLYLMCAKFTLIVLTVFMSTWKLHHHVSGLVSYVQLTLCKQREINSLTILLALK